MVYVLAFFADTSGPLTGLSPTVSILRISDNTLVVNAAAMTARALAGWYYYDFAAYDEDEEYAITADGGAGLDWYLRYKYSGAENADIKLILDDVNLVKVETDKIPNMITLISLIKTETDKIQETKDWVEIIRKIETGRWKIEADRLTLYDSDGTTPFLIFDLTGTNTKAYSERKPV